MVQTFNPDKVMLSETLGKEIKIDGFTTEFVEGLVSTSKTMQLGEYVEMGSQKIKEVSVVDGELSDAYFVGEGEKIGVAKVETKPYTLKTKKISVILPVTEEFLNYTWAQYFKEVKPLIVDKFNKMLDGDVFLGKHGNVFGNNVLAAATAATNVSSVAMSADAIYDLEMLIDSDPTAFVGHRTANRVLRSAVDTVSKEYIYDRNASTIDGIPYHELKLAQGVEYPKDNVFVGNFKGIKYGLPQGTQLRLKIADQATLSKVQNAGPDTGDVHLFEQDMQALRAIFEIAVAIPNNEAFAVLTPPTV